MKITIKITFEDDGNNYTTLSTPEAEGMNQLLSYCNIFSAAHRSYVDIFDNDSEQIKKIMIHDIIENNIKFEDTLFVDLPKEKQDELIQTTISDMHKARKNYSDSINKT